ncbi:MAG TPA: hypothetical protein VGF53_09835 [Pseudolabrys sp.]|jgi:hypothetical protein
MDETKTISIFVNGKVVTGRYWEHDGAVWVSHPDGRATQAKIKDGTANALAGILLGELEHDRPPA